MQLAGLEMLVALVSVGDARAGLRGRDAGVVAAGQQPPDSSAITPIEIASEATTISVRSTSRDIERGRETPIADHSATGTELLSDGTAWGPAPAAVTSSAIAERRSSASTSRSGNAS